MDYNSNVAVKLQEPFALFRNIDYIPVSVKNQHQISIEWEFSAVCPDVDIAEMKSLRSQEIKYFEEADTLRCGCGKLKKVSGKVDTVDCTALEDSANFYLKTNLFDPSKCMIETTPKNEY